MSSDLRLSSDRRCAGGVVAVGIGIIVSAAVVEPSFPPMVSKGSSQVARAGSRSGGIPTYGLLRAIYHYLALKQNNQYPHKHILVLAQFNLKPSRLHACNYACAANS